MERDDRQDDDAIKRRQAVVDAVVASARLAGTPLTPETAALFEAYVQGILQSNDVLAVIMRRHVEHSETA